VPWAIWIEGIHEANEVVGHLPSTINIQKIRCVELVTNKVKLEKSKDRHFVTHCSKNRYKFQSLMYNTSVKPNQWTFGELNDCLPNPRMFYLPTVCWRSHQRGAWNTPSPIIAAIRLNCGDIGFNLPVSGRHREADEVVRPGSPQIISSLCTSLPGPRICSGDS
jgi:hypothetical protein